jgi:hypothetical protein
MRPASTQWAARQPEHDDMVQKADGRSLSVNRSTAGTGLAARCFRPVPRENCSESRIGSSQSHCSVPYVKVHFRCVSCIVARLKRRQASRYKKAAFMVGNFGPGVHRVSGYDAPSHMHLWFKQQDRYQQSCSPYCFPGC